MVSQAVDFSALKVQQTIQIPWSCGISYEGIVYIEKWNVFAFGCQNDQEKHSIGLYDLGAERIISSLHKIHQSYIVNVIWIDHKNYLLTGSFDCTIRVFGVSDHGRTLRALHVFRGHTDLVRCLKYIPDENLLVSAGYDTNIKLIFKFN